MRGRYALVWGEAFDTASYVPLTHRAEMRDLSHYFRGAPPHIQGRFKIQKRAPTEEELARNEARYQEFFGAEWEDDVEEEDDEAGGAMDGAEEKELDLNAEIAQQADAE